MTATIGAARGFHVMSKPTGAICNLDCDYCFFLSKELLYPDSGFRMDPATHEAYIQQLLAAHSDAAEVVVAFQGGEPTLMGIDFFERTLALEQKYRRPGQQILNTIQTNATLIDDKWADFLTTNEFLVGVSIDGPRAMHDAYRTDKGGKPTFDRVMAGLDRLRTHGAQWNALTT
nr:radical SAM protein [Candidatus Nanopelagicales bacterium]